VKSLRNAAVRVALWGLIAVLLLSAILPLTAASSSTTYTLYGYVHQPSPTSPIPAGVTVDLISSATGQTYATTTTTGGQFVFSSATNAPALAPGSWGVWVPTQTNASLAGCGPYGCAILPPTTAPQYLYQSSGNLTSGGTSFVTIRDVDVLQYNATINGTVTYAGSAARGATVELLDASYNNLVLVSNGTNARGAYTMEAPAGTWVLKTIYPGPTVRYNVSRITVPAFGAVHQNIVIQDYLIQGYLSATNGAVTTSGNVTVYDPANGYIYSSPTPPGGFYSFGSYRNFTTAGPQTFDVFLSATNYSTVWYETTVANGSTVTKNVVTTPAATSQRESYATTLNFAGFNSTLGTGSLSVYTNATLGNNTIFPTLANATVGQLWSQLGLDFSHGLTLVDTSVPAVLSWINSTGAFFPAIQAGTSINGTTFTTSYGSGGQPLYNFRASTPCSTTNCGPSSTASLTLNYSAQYPLSGSVVAKSPAYTISFSVLHPSWFGTYIYNVILPVGFILQAGTAAPAGTSLTATGPGGTWSSFAVTSLPYSASYTTVTLPILKAGNVTAIVNVTGSNFAFSKANVLNATNGNYTVVLGQYENATFSAINSVYGAGTNGSLFHWNFGNGQFQNVTNSSYATTNYTKATLTTPYQGSLTIRSSGGRTNTTRFMVWVVPPNDVQANISDNATGHQVRSADGVRYLYVNASTTLFFNATKSSANVSHPNLPGVLSIAYFTATSTTFKQTANYSTSQNAYFGTNFTVLFSGAGARYLQNTTVNGVTIPFLGWQYWVNLTVFDGGGFSSKASIMVLVNDTQKPKPAFSLLSSNGRYITGGSITEGTNFTAQVLLNGANSSDPNNGSVVRYLWNITNSGNSTFHFKNITQNAAPPSYKFPGRVPVWLAPQSTPYLINLTATDRAGNKAWTTQSLTVAVNATTRPIMAANNLTGPSSVTVGNSVSYWVNVTTGGGSKAVALNVTVTFYLLPPSGLGSHNVIVSPSDVKWYNYSSPGVVNTTLSYTGTYPSLAYNKTVRAQISWTPGPTGNWNLYANVSAQNEFSGDYINGPQTAVLAISVNQSPLTVYLEYGIIAAVAVVVVVLLFILYRRRRSRARPSGGKAGLERGSKRDRSKDDSS
jgi:hypothetical protein